MAIQNLTMHHGVKRWAAELVSRLVGALLLSASYRLALAAHRMVVMPPHHQATAGEFAICAAAVVLLWGGLAFAIEGTGLFRLVPVPPRLLWN